MKNLILIFLFFSGWQAYSQCSFKITPAKVCEGAQISFEAPAGSTQWQWDISTVTSNQKNPAHIFNSAGTYTIKLICTIGTQKCTSTVQLEVFERPQIRSKLISSDTQCYKGNQFCFRDSSISSSPIRNISYLYDPSAQIEIIDSPTGAVSLCHTYAGGTKTPTNIYVTVQVSDTNGCITKVTKLHSMLVYGDLGLKAVSDFPIGCDSISVTFTNLSKADSSDLSYWAWNVSDGVFIENKSWKPGLIYTYRTYGIKTAYLIATNRFGCTDTYKIGEVGFLMY